ncbi:MAG: organomercurial lyase [Methylocella sp.]|jgi:mercuric reductase
MPIVPDRTMVMTEAAREALDGILVAAWYDKRFGDLGTAAASVLAMLLRLYAHEGRPPSAKEIAAATGFTELETARLLTALSQHDLVILERDGAAIRGAYPFTQSATGHSLTFVRRERTLNTMCAIDALGAGAMCREDTIIRSGCHLCGVPVIVETRNRGMALDEVRPRSAVVWTGFRASRGCAADSLCTALVFFCSDGHLDLWRASGKTNDGRRLSVEEAFQVGKSLFADRALCWAAAETGVPRRITGEHQTGHR